MAFVCKPTVVMGIVGMLFGSGKVCAQPRSCAPVIRDTIVSHVVSRTSTTAALWSELRFVLDCDAKPASTFAQVWQAVPSDSSVLEALVSFTNERGSPILARELVAQSLRRDRPDVVRLSALAALSAQLHPSAVVPSAAALLRWAGPDAGRVYSTHPRDSTKDTPLSESDIAFVRKGLASLLVSDVSPDVRRAAAWLLRYPRLAEQR